MKGELHIDRLTKQVLPLYVSPYNTSYKTIVQYNGGRHFNLLRKFVFVVFNDHKLLSFHCHATVNDCVHCYNVLGWPKIKTAKCRMTHFVIRIV